MCFGETNTISNCDGPQSCRTCRATSKPFMRRRDRSTTTASNDLILRWASIWAGFAAWNASTPLDAKRPITSFAKVSSGSTTNTRIAILQPVNDTALDLSALKSGAGANVVSKPSIEAILRSADKRQGLCCFDIGASHTIITWASSDPHVDPHSWQAFVRGHLRFDTGDSDLFSGGVVGWLGYEAGTSVEAMPTQRIPRPTHDVCLWRVDGAIQIDHKESRISVHGSPAFRAEAQDVLETAQALKLPRTEVHDDKPWKPHNADARSLQYMNNVEDALRLISRGELYQVNLAWEQDDVAVTDALQAWIDLRTRNPSTRGCYLRQVDVEVLSNSPELFIEYSPETRQVCSTPIKGTAPVSAGLQGRDALLTSPKERAKLTMIVDLVRNDLGRVAVPGTVATSDRTVRQCGNLWHAEQTVTATVLPALDSVDVVAAAFPPGSVTGAPKVRAMQAIHRLEERPRGIYTGSLGFFADGGRAHFNVAIRTATVKEGRARFHVGAGIVAESVAEQEWRETLDKAQAMATALGTVNFSP